MTDARAFLIVMDSVGIGGAPDADRFFNDGRPDTGANTVGHMAAARPLNMPVLAGLGLGAAVRLASGQDAPGLMAEPQGLWGAATEISNGKDTPSGHWEIAGVPVPWDWHYFPVTHPSFPPEVTARICELAETTGILGNCHGSGTAIIDELGLSLIHI